MTIDYNEIIYFYPKPMVLPVVHNQIDVALIKYFQWFSNRISY